MHVRTALAILNEVNRLVRKSPNPDIGLLVQGYKNELSNAWHHRRNPDPVDENLEPDIDRFFQQAIWALDNGCDGLNILGSTGEAASLSLAQRKRIMTAAAIRLNSSRLMVGTGACDIAGAIDLIQLAAQMRYAGALVPPPYYYKPISDNSMIAWFGALVDATSEHPIAIYLYNIPRYTGVTFSARTVARLKAAFPDRIAGIKDSSGNIDQTIEYCRIDGLQVFPGTESFLGSIEDGIAGCISATLNVTVPEVADFWKDRSDGDKHAAIVAKRDALAAFPLVPAIKYLLAKRFDDPEFERVLPPHLPLDSDQKAQLEVVFEAAQTHESEPE